MSGFCENLLLVQAEFDGELDAGQAASLAAHRAQCAACRQATENLRKLRGDIRTHASYHRAPDDLRAQLMAKAVARQKSPQHWGRAAVSFVVGAALAASLAFAFIAPSGPDFADAALTAHLRALQPGHLEDVVSTDQHTVKPWFDGKLDFAPPVKDFKEQGYPLEGGRLDYLAGRPVAALVYGRAKHVINVFVWPADSAARTTDLARKGYNIVHWSADGMNFWAVSDLEKDELAAFARLWQAS